MNIGTVLNRYGDIKFLSTEREDLSIVLNHYGLDESVIKEVRSKEGRRTYYILMDKNNLKIVD